MNMDNKKDDNMETKPSNIPQQLERDTDLRDKRANYNRFPWLRYTKAGSENQYQDTILRRGAVVNNRDLYFLKTMESSASTSTFTWFLNYTLQKDLQSMYRQPNSCLVPELGSSNPFMNTCYSENKDTPTNERFEIRIENTRDT